jgi:hypothetical protein
MRQLRLILTFLCSAAAIAEDTLPRHFVGLTALPAATDRNDADRLWVTAWGGTNVPAQALWNVAPNRLIDYALRILSS